MNLSMKDSDFGPIIVNMYGGGQERGPTVSLYSHLQKPVGGFIMVCCYISGRVMGDPVKIDGIMNTDSLILIHTMACNIIKKVSGWHGLIY